MWPALVRDSQFKMSDPARPKPGQTFDCVWAIAWNNRGSQTAGLGISELLWRSWAALRNKLVWEGAIMYN